MKPARKRRRTTRTPRPDDAAARELERLRQENERLRQQVDDQAKQIDDLKRQLALRQQNSTTTSKPPSSDGLAGQQRLRGRQTTSRRKPGGQPGHPGHHRSLVPLERVQTIVDVVPEACRHCDHRLQARHDVGDPRRHQVTELPPIEAHITEYRCHRRMCPGCGQTTLAPLPDDLAGQFGPQLTALIAYLTVVCRLPRLVVQRLLEGALHIPLSLGSTQKAWEETSAAVAAPYHELQHALAQQAVLNSDETGYRTNGAKRWLWTLVAPTFIFYTIATSRSADVLRGLLGATFAGILGSDRLPTYLTYPVGLRQFCWSHFRRNLLSAKVLPIEKKFFALAERHVHAASDDVANLAQALFVHLPHFFTFVHEEGVEPTNNVAERALRTAVQWRKIMFGNRSADGELAVARLLTVTRTCQLQQINTLTYLTAAIRCYRRRHAVASLLPKLPTP